MAHYLTLFFPELTLLTALVLVMLVSLMQAPQDERGGGTAAYVITQAALWVALLGLWITQDVEHPRLVMSGTLLRNALTMLMQSAALLGLSLTLVYGRALLRRQQLMRPETFMLFLCSTLGVLAVIGAYHFVPLYLGLELMALPLYAMVALRKDDALSVEAGLKYLFLGALASGFMLYGMSLVYGATGSLSMLAIGRAAMEPATSQTLLMLGLFFIIAGLAFKLSAVPFHMWAPDVYRGAPTPVVLFISTVPKIAVVMLLLRLMSGPLASLMLYWQGILALLAVLSMVIGAVVAIAQTHLKRMLAYSTIGHMGYLLLGALSGGQAGFSAALFYILTYVLSNLVAFGVLLSMEDDKGSGITLEDMRGLARRAPVRAALMALTMLSLAGIPPLLGFYGKFAVIEVAINNGFVGLSVVAIITSVIAAFYYLRVVRLMYFSTAEETAQISPPLAWRSQGLVAMTVLTVNGLALLVLGLFPQILLEQVIQALLWAGVI